MHITFSSAMLRSIDDNVQEARARGSIINVYRVAETIRRKHIDDNVALEDIIELLVKKATENLTVEFNKSDLHGLHHTHSALETSF